MTTPDTPTDPVERLIAAWHRWEAHPASKLATIERLDAITAAQLHSGHTHKLIAAARRAGYSVSDAVQTAYHQLAPREVA